MKRLGLTGIVIILLFYFISPRTNDLPNPNMMRTKDIYFEIPNLITNGDFSNGTTGWVTFSTPNTITITDKVTFLGLATSSAGYYQDINIPDNSLIYLSVDTVYLSGQKPKFVISNKGGFDNASTLTDLFDNKSMLTTSKLNNGTRIYIRQANGETYNSTIDNIKIISVTTLINNKQYSPMFNTTFDLMTDELRKLQLDDWAQNNFVNNKIVVDIKVDYYDITQNANNIGNIIIERINIPIELFRQVSCGAIGVLNILTLGQAHKYISSDLCIGPTTNVVLDYGPLPSF